MYCVVFCDNDIMFAGFSLIWFEGLDFFQHVIAWYKNILVNGNNYKFLVLLGIYNFFTAFLIADHNVNLQNWLYQISTCKVYHNPH